MAKIGASGKNILRGRAPWAGIPQAGRAGKSTNRPPAYWPNGNIPGSGGLPECPTIGTHNNPYNIEDYYLPKNYRCIWPGGGSVRPDGEYEVLTCDNSDGGDSMSDMVRFPTTPWGDLEDKIGKVGDKGIKAPDTIGYGAGWGAAREMRTVVGIFWPSQSEMAGHVAAGMAPWTKAEFMAHMGNKLKDSIRDMTHGALEIVGGGYSPGTGQNPSDIDYEWVGNPDGNNTTITCGSTAHPINCGCGGTFTNGFVHKLTSWFNNNGYIDGWNNATQQAIPTGYDLKIAINLDCFSSDIAGNAGADPMVFINVDKTAGLGNTPPVLLDMTNVAEVLGDGRVAQVVNHEIGHSIGHMHTSKYLPTTIAGVPGHPDCYAQPFQPPNYHCNRTNYGYQGLDDLDLMSYGGGAENRFGIYRECHFTAYKKFLMGKIPLWLGPHDIVDLEQFPPQCAHAPNITTGNTQIISLAAHDQFHDDPDMVENISNSKTMLLLIRRDIDASEAIDDINCESNVNDRLTPERYIAISYRRKAFWRGIGTTQDPQNGALIMDWGPLRTYSTICGTSPPYGTGVLAKMDASDTNTVWTLDAYTANGRSFPRIDIKISDNPGHPGQIGPNQIRIEYKIT
tara:strand:+ start:1863 stop:3725 length:1863 start_codon:yes stop_codon:yes gene_type:complete